MQMAVDLEQVRRVMDASRRDKPRWLSWPVVGGLLVLPALIVTTVPGEHILATLIAYINLLLAGTAGLHFVRTQTLQGALAFLFLLFYAVSYSLSPIYFAMTAPESFYSVSGSIRGQLDNQLRFQLVTLLFLGTYLAIVLPLMRERHTIWEITLDGARGARMARAITVLLAIVIGMHVVTRVRELGAAQYIIDGLFNYLWALPVLLGALFTLLPMAWRIGAAIVFPPMLGFYLIGNARGFALLPVVTFVLGFLLFARVKQTRKTAMLAAFAVAFPILMVIGNTTRTVLGTASFEDIGTRVQALSQWREVTQEQSFVFQTMGRLFPVGGHSIIAYTPEEFSYLPLDAARYAFELVTRTFVPGRLYDARYYSNTTQLRNWGFNINEDFSVELTLIGALYMVGGYVPVFFGAIYMGLLHAFVFYLLARWHRMSPYLSLFMFGMLCDQFLGGRGEDPISLTRDMIWKIAFGLILFTMFIRPFLGRPSIYFSAQSPQQPETPLPSG